MHRHLHRLERVFFSHPVYFVTSCTHDRKPVLTQAAVVEILLREWKAVRSHHGWGIGRYVIMPDHVHFFCAEMPGQSDRPVKALSAFVGRWKEWTSKGIVRAGLGSEPVWQVGFFDHVLRNEESYAEKWSYVRENPVRKSLVVSADAWPYQGFVDFDMPLGL